LDYIVPYENLQEVFNKAYIGLASQGFLRSYGSSATTSNSCLYRDKVNNRKCAIGHCVPDEFVNDANNSKTLLVMLDTDVARFTGDPRWTKLFENISRSALRQLQHCHDTAVFLREDSPEKMRENLELFAKWFNLTIPDVKNETA
jgi:hypothetical protein